MPSPSNRFLLVALLLGMGAGGCAAPPQELALLDTPVPAGSETPFLSAGTDRLWLSWSETREGEPAAVRLASFDGETWSQPVTITEDPRLFVNWADFPGVSVGTDGSLAAYWFVRNAGGGHGYDAWLRVSPDGGGLWDEPIRLHRDSSLVQHGFVALAARSAGYDAVWLDGRANVNPDGEMKLVYSRWADGRLGEERVLDTDVCSCCQTDSLVLPDGLLVAYRDHTPDQTRDISVVRLRNGAWSEPRTVHADGWKIAGCPVNGPALAGPAERPAVAWFTEGDAAPRVLVALSADGGESFGVPVIVDDGDPLGRVDLLSLDDGSLVVAWLERSSARTAEVRVRRVGPDLFTGPSVPVGATDVGRPSGFPRIAWLAGRLYVAWTDTTGGAPRVRLAAGDPPSL